MLSVSASEAVLDQQLLEDAVLSEQGYELLTFDAPQDLLLRRNGSAASRYHWPDEALLSLAKVVARPLARLQKLIPRDNFITCVDACVEAMRPRTIQRGKIRAIAEDGEIMGVAGFRATPAKPSELIKLLLDRPEGVTDVRWTPQQLTVDFVGNNDTAYTRASLRIALDRAWTLDIRKGMDLVSGKTTWDKFRRYIVSDLASALFKIHTMLRIGMIR